MNAPEMSLVPPGRLAALLSEARKAHELDLIELSKRSNGSFTPAMLEDAERGRLPLQDDEVKRLTDLYGIDSTPIVPERSRLIVDLGEGLMTVGDTGISVGTGSGEVDVVLERYLSLLYIMRGLEPGTQLTLRERDLLVLGDTLEQEFALVEARLHDLMGATAVAQRTGMLNKKFSLPAAGLLVALTAVGTLVIVGGVGGSDDGPVDAGPTAGQIDDGTAAPAAGSGGGSILLPASFSGGGAFSESVDEAGDISDDLLELGIAAEATIDYDWQSALPGWTIEFEGENAGYRGMTNTPTKTISIFVDADDTVEDLAGVIAHEIGHAIDVVHLDDDARSAWLDARGIDGEWWPGDGAQDFEVGAGDFAEAVAAVIAGSASDSEHGEFTADQLDLVRDLLPDGGSQAA